MKQVNGARRGEAEAALTKGMVADVHARPHAPWLVLLKDVIVITPNTGDLLYYPDDTEVLVQWPGNYRSDFFQLTVGDVRHRLRILRQCERPEHAWVRSLPINMLEDPQKGKVTSEAKLQEMRAKAEAYDALLEAMQWLTSQRKAAARG
jgi:hypothetical protein